MLGPDPDTRYPVPGLARIAFLKNLITLPYIEVGEYTYYDDPVDPAGFERHCVLYHSPFDGDRLIIGRFCAIGQGVRFLMNGANHKMNGFSTYPFGMFGHGWEKSIPHSSELTDKGDIVVGNDVWIGCGVTIMPGVKVGDGAIIGSEAVVTNNVPPYAIVAGNPARVVRFRFSEEIIAQLLAIAWWNWPVARISTSLEAITCGDKAWLDSVAQAK